MLLGMLTETVSSYSVASDPVDCINLTQARSPLVKATLLISAASCTSKRLTLESVLFLKVILI